MVGYMKQIDPQSNGIFNPNAFNINTIVMEAGDGPVVIDNLSASFQAAINLASAEGIIHPQLKNMMNTATRINTNDLSDVNQLYKLAEINNQLTTRFGSSVNLMDTITQDALEIFWNDVSNKPDNIDLKFYADKYLSIINPDATDYDEKKARLVTIMETKGLDFAQILETEFVAEEVFRFMTGSSKLELVPQDIKDAQFLLQNTEIKEVFNEYVYEYLIAFNPKLTEIVPSKFEATGFFDIGNWFKDGNEAGQQGVKAIQYAIKRLGQEGYGND